MQTKVHHNRVQSDKRFEGSNDSAVHIYDSTQFPHLICRTRVPFRPFSHYSCIPSQNLWQESRNDFPLQLAYQPTVDGTKETLPGVPPMQRVMKSYLCFSSGSRNIGWLVWGFSFQ